MASEPRRRPRCSRPRLRAGRGHRRRHGGHHDELVTVAPGEEGCAALLVSGGGTDEAEVTGMDLTLQGAQPGSKIGEPTGVGLPGVDSLFMDDGVRVTYLGSRRGFGNGLHQEPLTDIMVVCVPPA